MLVLARTAHQGVLQCAPVGSGFGMYLTSSYKELTRSAILVAVRYQLPDHSNSSRGGALERRPQVRLHRGSLRQRSRRKGWNYGHREAKMITKEMGPRVSWGQHDKAGSGSRATRSEIQMIGSWMEGVWCEERTRGVVHDQGHEL